MNEHIHYTQDGKGFVLYADDGTPYEVKNFADAYDKDKFFDLMKKGGKARDWVARHNLFGYYVKNKEYGKDGAPLSKEDAQLQALPRYMSDESWYDEDNYFWMKVDGFDKPLLSQLRISNHNTVHSQYEKSHSNDDTVDCQTCLNVIIGDKAYNRDTFEKYAKGGDAIISVETFFDEDKRSEEQILQFEKFVEKVRSGSQPTITMDEIRKYIDPNPRIVISQGGKEVTASLANVRPSQYLERKNRSLTRTKPRGWNAEKEPPFIMPKAFKYSDVVYNGTSEIYTDKDGDKYEVFIYSGRRFAYDGKKSAYLINNRGNINKKNGGIPVLLDESVYRKHNILEKNNIMIFSKKNNGLRRLGEGKIYSKKELSLNEDVTGRVYTKKQLKLSEAWTNGKVALTLNPNGQDVTPSSVQTSAQNMLNNVPQATAVTLQADDVDGVTAPTFNPEDPRNDTVQNISAKKATSSAVQNAAKNGGTINITKDDPQQGGMGESKKGSDKLIEMRRNSIPFSKTELSKFLRSL